MTYPPQGQGQYQPQYPQPPQKKPQTPIERWVRRLWGSGRNGKIAIVGAVAFLLLCCSLTGRQMNENSNATATAVSLQQQQLAFAAATQAAIPTATLKPSNTPTITLTPSPTNTPRPTNTPQPTKTPTPLPEPVSITGRGQSVTDPVIPPAGLNRIVFAHDGRRNFIVTAYNPDGEETYLTNAIGRYAGQKALAGREPVYFDVNADGEWMIRIEPLELDQSIAEGIEGAGDTVSGIFYPNDEGAVPYLFTHDGARNFIIQLYCQGGADYVQNEIGPVDGASVVKIEEGPCFWEVQADGNWSIKPR